MLLQQRSSLTKKEEGAERELLLSCDEIIRTMTNQLGTTYAKSLKGRESRSRQE